MGEFQSILLGLIFSYLLAKLISFVVTFKDQNLTITRNSDADYAPLESGTFPDPIKGGVLEDDSILPEQGSEIGSDDDDWEGVESTELDQFFSAATAFVAADRGAHHKVPTDVQLQLYGLYKIATEGPCSAPQPSALKMTARSKWQAWQKLGAMPPEDAMQKYIDIVTELFPSWIAGSGVKKKGRDGTDGEEASKDGKGGPMGPVFSTYVYEEESGTELKMDAIHDFAREGDYDNLLKCIESGASVNDRDSEGRTPLHWAVDRGHHNIAELLLTKNADVNAKDNEGQTPLHYAVVCEREIIAEYLVKQNADADIKDNDGESPSDICDLNWPCMTRSTAT